MIPLRDSVRSSRLPVVNLTIIILNLLIYFWEATIEPHYLNQIFFVFGLIPADIINAIHAGVPMVSMVPIIINFITATFLHGGWVHVIGNMLFLWVFGDNIEDKLGHLRYLLFYLLAGLASGLFHILANPNSNVPVIGASGAVAGVLGAYLVLFPHARILALVPIFIIFTLMEIPAVIFIALWFLIQLFNGVATLGGTAHPVAWWAHIGGFVMGMLLIKILARGTRVYRY